MYGSDNSGLEGVNAGEFWDQSKGIKLWWSNFSQAEEVDLKYARDEASHHNKDWSDWLKMWEARGLQFKVHTVNQVRLK